LEGLEGSDSQGGQVCSGCWPKTEGDQMTDITALRELLKKATPGPWVDK
jgi:hypothetical protein